MGERSGKRQQHSTGLGWVRGSTCAQRVTHNCREVFPVHSEPVNLFLPPSADQRAIELEGTEELRK